MKNLAGNSQCEIDYYDYPSPSCCSKKKPCGVGQGDCDDDYECVDDLVCGKDNCGGWGLMSYDCCEKGI